MKASYRLLLAILALSLSVIYAFGQAETGQIAGTVTDPSGAVVPNASVTITSVATGMVRTATTSDSGNYTITNLPPGSYDVVIEGRGFSLFKRRLQVVVGSRNAMDAALQVTAAGTVVEVVAGGGAQVETQSQTLGNTVSQQQITQLPTLTRDPYDLVATGGQVAEFGATDPNVSTRGAGNFAINGQRPASTDILLDGGENVDLFTAAVGQSVPLDSVQEFRVLTSNFTAEYGRASGGVVNVATRSGSNEFHGTAYEFNRISKLAANNPENKAQGQPRSIFTRNQFGYSVGGPVVKNKLFFFSSTEWTRVRSSELQRAIIVAPEFIAAAAPNTQQFFTDFGALAPGVTVEQTFLKGDPIFAAEGITGGALFGVLAPTTPVFQQVNFKVPSNAGGGDPQNTWSTVDRIDFNFTDKTTFYARYGGEHGELFPGSVTFSPFNGYNSGQSTFNQNILGSITHIFAPSLVWSGKVVYNRLNLQQPLGSAPIGPTLYIQESTVGRFNGQQIGFPGYSPFSPGNAIPFGGPQNLYQFHSDLNWVKGRHNFRFGGLYIHTRDNRQFGAFEEAVANLAPQGNISLAVENFLAGQLRSFQAAVDPQGKFPCPVDAAGASIVTPECTLALPVGPPNFGRNNRYHDWAVYAQDSWKLTPRLNVSLGVRYEYYGVQHNVDPRLDSNFYFGSGASIFEQIRNGQVFRVPDSPIGGIWEPDENNFAPRIGFAWDVFGTGKTSLRGGYGISYERNFGNVTFNVIQNPPAYAVISLIAGADVPTIPITSDNAGPLAGTGTKALPRTSLRHINQNLDTAYAQSYSLALEHQLWTNSVFAVEYSGSRGIKLYTLENPNRPGSGAVFLGDAVLPTNAFPRLNRQYTNINTRGGNGDSYYNSLNLRWNGNNIKNSGLTLTTNYTYSHTIDNLSSTFSETSNNFNLGLLDPFNPGLDRGNSDFDIRHRLAVSAIWETPWYKSGLGFGRQVFGGWSFAPIITAQTGTPFTIFDCTNAFQVCPRVMTNTKPQLEGGDGTPVAGAGNLFDFIPIPSDQIGVFANPIVGVSDFGPFPANMTGRNAFRGPGRWNVDLGIYKSFKMTERIGMQFRGEFFNLVNHPNLFVLGSTADASAGPGSFVQAKRGGILGNDIREHRNVQLGLKITF